MERKWVIGIIVVLVLIAIGFYAYSITGNAINVVRVCDDSDVTLKYKDGLNYYEAGTVSYSIHEKEIYIDRSDYCVDSGLLKEYQCVKTIGGKKIRPITYKCRCADGACIE
jgi:lipopolysaccharide export system protein LptC